MLLPMVCILRIALTFLTLTSKVLNPYGYASIYLLVIHSFQVIAMIMQMLLLKSMRFLHISAQFILLVLNCFWLVIIFWPSLYYKLLSDPNGRSIITILSNPTNSKNGSTKTQQQKTRVHSATLRFYNRSKMILSAPQSQGAYAHVDESGKDCITDLLFKDLYHKQIYHDDPLMLKVPYEFMAKRQIEPPDGLLFDTIAFIAIVLTFLWPVLRGYIKLLTILLYRKMSKYIPTLRGRYRNENIEQHVKKKKKKKRVTALTVKAISKDKYAFLAENVNDSILSTWDTDGIFFCVDNCATCIICNDKSMFVGDLKPSRSEVHTSNGQNTPAMEGTIRLVLTDDTGDQHQYDIPGALYDPESPFNLLGVPYLSKHFKDAKTMGTKITSGAFQSTFVWDHGKNERNFQHGIDCLPTLQVNVGTSYYKAFCTRLRSFYNDNIKYGFRTETRSLKVSFKGVPDTVNSKKRKLVNLDSEVQKGMELSYKDGQGSSYPVVYEGACKENKMHEVKKEDGSTMVVDESQLLQMHQPDLTNIPSTPLEYQKEIENGYLPTEEAMNLARPRRLSPVQQMLMDWHHRLYHLQFRRIFMLAERGFLPKVLLECKDNVPLCVSCQFGTAHRRPWRFSKQSGKIRKEKEVKPGDGQSIDQIVSAQPGLIPQMSGFLTKERYYGATTIVDHVSDYVYVHLMKSLTLDETIKAKRSWEKILHNAGHTVKHYQADNGRFADKGFIDDCDAHDQTISYCGVGAHHQNGIVEAKNKLLTQGARTMLLHGIRMWPQLVTTMFWPFALKAMAERMNRLHIHADGSTPESRLYGLCGEAIPVGSYHTLFCPVYVLDAKSQGPIGPPKWEPRSRIGVYLGHSPFHAGSVALVLNPTTGHVSPQFYVVFDDNFSTVLDGSTTADNCDDAFQEAPRPPKKELDLEIGRP